jgi:glucose-1-phosphate thymidylyltransferase
MKAVIPVAGTGKMLRPHTHTQPKPLLPVAGKPILGHIVERLLAAGLDDFVFVLGYMGEKIRQYVETEYAQQARCTYIQQEPRMGPGHAIWLCRDLVGQEPIFIVFGDTIVDADLRGMIAQPCSVVGVQEVDDPSSFGIAITNEQGRIVSMTEKPLIPKSQLALVGVYCIRETEALFEALQWLIDNGRRSHHEYHLTDALMRLIDLGICIQTQKVRNWFDCGQVDALLKTNRVLLDQQAALPLPAFEDVVIVPPVHIAAGCTIRRSVIGPHVAIAEHAHIEDSVVADSILGAYATLQSIVLRHSIVGNDAQLIGRHQRINIGENTVIDFGA